MTKIALRKGDWVVEDVPLSVARDFISLHHYSKGCSNTRVYTHGLVKKEDGKLYGVAMWLPPTKVAAESVNKDNWQKVLSLTRLACCPDAPKNAASFLMASSIRKIRDDGRFVSLVTYADVRMGHSGAIYKATNWDYVGEMRGSPAWVDPATGRQVARKSTKSRNTAEMLALGYECLGVFGKHKFIMHLTPQTHKIKKGDE
jgi:hypothetical protein